MTAYVSWIKKELAHHYPGFDARRGVDLNRNGRIDRNERITDANNNGVIGDHADWIAFYKTNEQFLRRSVGGMFRWGAAFSPDNPIHDVIMIERAVFKPPKVKAVYAALMKIRKYVDQVLATGRYSPSEKLMIVYSAMRSLGYKLDDNLNDDSFISNILTRHVDCDTSSLAVLAVAHEFKLYPRLVLAPRHVFLRHDAGKGKAFNIDYGHISQTSSLIKKLNISKISIKSGIYLKPLDRTGTISLVYAIVAAVMMKQLPHSRTTEVPVERIIKRLRISMQLYPRSIYAYQNFGMLAFHRDKFHLALFWFNRALRMDPNCVDILVLRAKTLLAIDSYTQALADISHAISLNETPDYYALRSTAYIKLKRLPEALRDINRAIAKSPSPAYYRQRGIVHFFLKNYDRAHADFRIAINSNVGNGLLLRLYIATLTKLGHLEEALNITNKFIRHTGEKSITRLERKLPSIYLHRAVIYHHLGRHADAVHDFGRVSRRHFLDIAEAFFLIESMVKMRRYRDAISQLNYLLVKTNMPAKDIGYMLRARAYDRIGNLRQALADIGTSLSLNRNNAKAHRFHAELLVRSGAHHKALAAYGRAMVLAPHDAPMALARARLAYRLGHYRATAHDCRAALRFSPNDTNAHMLCARAFLRMKRYGDALEHLNHVIAADPRSDEAYSGRSRAHERLGMHARALKDIDAAIALNSKNAAYHNRRGIMMARQGRTLAARNEFNRSRTLDPSNRSSSHNLARTRYVPALSLGFQPRLIRNENNSFDMRTSIGAQWNCISLSKHLGMGIALETGYAAGNNRHSIDIMGGPSLILEMRRSTASLDVGAGYVFGFGDAQEIEHSRGPHFYYRLSYRHSISSRISLGARLMLQHRAKEPRHVAAAPGLELIFNVW